MVPLQVFNHHKEKSVLIPRFSVKSAPFYLEFRQRLRVFLRCYYQFFVFLERKMCFFHFQQETFLVETAVVAREAAVAADDTMAGDEDT